MRAHITYKSGAKAGFPMVEKVVDKRRTIVIVEKGGGRQRIYKNLVKEFRVDIPWLP